MSVRAARAIALVAVGVLAACGARRDVEVSAAAPVAPAWQVRASGGMTAIAVGTEDPALLDATQCRACHEAISDEWARSRHALAWTNGLFAREYGEAPKPWCVNCHAPTEPQQAQLAAGGGALVDQGVNCATCHVRNGALVSAKRAAASPHATTVDPSFGTPAFCADCHEFTFPVLGRDGVPVRMTGHPMQATVSSFAAGPYAREPDGCMTCHGSRHGHAFAGGHDSDMLGAALEVDWCTEGDELALSVTNVAAGHVVPTGDIHRHLLLRVWRSSAPAGVWEAFFGRRFEQADDGGKRTVWDSGLDPRETKKFRIALSALADGDADADVNEPVNLELVYVYVADEFPRRDRVPTEPTAATVIRWRTPTPSIPRCTP